MYSGFKAKENLNDHQICLPLSIKYGHRVFLSVRKNYCWVCIFKCHINVKSRRNSVLCCVGACNSDKTYIIHMGVNDISTFDSKPIWHTCIRSSVVSTNLFLSRFHYVPSKVDCNFELILRWIGHKFSLQNGYQSGEYWNSNISTSFTYVFGTRRFTAKWQNDRTLYGYHPICGQIDGNWWFRSDRRKW